MYMCIYIYIHTMYILCTVDHHQPAACRIKRGLHALTRMFVMFALVYLMETGWSP